MPPLALASGDESSAARVVDSDLPDFESPPSAVRVSAVESVGAALLPFVSTSNCGKAATPVLREVIAANVRMIEEIFMMVIIYCNGEEGGME